MAARNPGNAEQTTAWIRARRPEWKRQQEARRGDQVLKGGMKDERLLRRGVKSGVKDGNKKMVSLRRGNGLHTNLITCFG